MNWVVEETYESLSERAARLLLATVRNKRDARLGLPTGSTPTLMYERVSEICEERYVCFAGVETFNLDEYVGIPKDHPSSYRTYMRRRLFDHVDVDLDRTHLPSGDPEVLDERFPGVPFDKALALECHRYESMIREDPLDLTILGLGRNGHIGFNEPGTAFDSVTHVVVLDESTRKANAPWFLDRPVPERAITMGLDTILQSRKIVLLAAGEAKRAIIRRLHDEPPSTAIPASVLERHDDVTVIVDREAAGDLAL